MHELGRFGYHYCTFRIAFLAPDFEACRGSCNRCLKLLITDLLKGFEGLSVIGVDALIAHSVFLLISWICEIDCEAVLQPPAALNLLRPRYFFCYRARQ